MRCRSLWLQPLPEAFLRALATPTLCSSAIRFSRSTECFDQRFYRLSSGNVMLTQQRAQTLLIFQYVGEDRENMLSPRK